MVWLRDFTLGYTKNKGLFFSKKGVVSLVGGKDGP